MKKNEKSSIKKNIKYIFIIAVLGVFLDQIVKYFIRICFTNENITKSLINGGKYLIFNIIPNRGIELIKNFFYIINVENTGGAWGLFSGNVTSLAIVSLFVVMMLYLFLKSESNLTKLSITYYGFLFAGIIGNLIDRVINGYVTDYLNFYIFGYDYPVFNIADILIVIGMLLMVVDVVRGEVYDIKKHKRKC